MSDEKKPKDEGVELNDAQFELQKGKQEMGVIGRWFGSKETAPTHYAGVITLLILIILGLVAIFGGPDRMDMIKIFGGFFLAALGYMFGSISGGKH